MWGLRIGNQHVKDFHTFSRLATGMLKSMEPARKRKSTGPQFNPDACACACACVWVCMLACVACPIYRLDDTDGGDAGTSWLPQVSQQHCKRCWNPAAARQLK